MALNKFDIYTRLEVLLGFEHSAHNDTPTEASSLIDDIHERGQIQNKHQYRNALDNFFTHSMELPSNILEQIAFNTRPKLEEHMLIVMD